MQYRNQFMSYIRNILFSNQTMDSIGTNPMNCKTYSDFHKSYLEKNGYTFNDENGVVIVTKDGEQLGAFTNKDKMFDYIIAFTIYLKENDLVDDFMKFYHFK